MEFDLDDYNEIFIEEASEQLSELNENLLKLEADPKNKETITNIFRISHTLKGSAASMGYNSLRDLSHKLEDILQEIREDKISLNGELIDLLFESLDSINLIIKRISSKQKIDVDVESLILKLSNACTKRVSTEQVSEELELVLTEEDHMAIDELIKNGLKIYEIYFEIDKNAKAAWIKGELVLNNIERIGKLIKTEPDRDKLSTEAFKHQVKAVFATTKNEKEIYLAADIDLVQNIAISKLVFSKEIQGVKEIYADDLRSGRSIKIDIEKLDNLLNLVGELVITNSAFIQIKDSLATKDSINAIEEEFHNLVNKTAQMSRIAKMLQDGIMNARMIQIGQIFKRFKRIIRDEAKKRQKKIIVEISGEDTELDKKIIDGIGEPLLHLVRNSIDHGIESEEERIKKGKEAQGHIFLKAYQSGSHIYIEFRDDGRGLDQKRILNTAIERGFLSQEKADKLSKQEIFQFIFKPYFSTSKRITDISGRGVGMNVVKETIEKLNGNIEIESFENQGTRFTFIFPLTLAIIPTISIKVEDELFEIPISIINRILKLHVEDIRTVRQHKMIKLQDMVIPLIDIKEILYKQKREYNEDFSIIIINYNKRLFSISVDEIIGKHEIVIKPLERHFRVVRGIAGTTIQGDGTVSLILDIPELINITLNNETLSDIYNTTESIQEELQTVKKTIEVTEMKKQKINLDKIKQELQENVSALKNTERIDEEIDELSQEEDDKQETEKKIIDKEEFDNSIQENYEQEDLNQENILNEIVLQKFEALCKEAIRDAISSLKALAGQDIGMKVPLVKYIDIEDIYNNIDEKDKEDEVFGSLLKIEGELNGNFVFIITEAEALKLTNLIMQTNFPDGSFSMEGEEVIKEVTNIIGSSLINLFANKLLIKTQPSVPTLSFDYLGSIVNGIIAEEMLYNDKAILLKTEFSHSTEKIKGRILFMPSATSVSLLAEKIMEVENA